MATVGEVIVEWYGVGRPPKPWRFDTADDLCVSLGVPFDTENTPHAIAAAVLGISEDDLRRRLLWGERIEQLDLMEWRPFARIAAGPDMDEFDSTDLAQANGAEALLVWLTRPEDER